MEQKLRCQFPHIYFLVSDAAQAEAGAEIDTSFEHEAETTFEHQCEFCDFSTKFKKSLKRHINNKHKDEQGDKVDYGC